MDLHDRRIGPSEVAFEIGNAGSRELLALPLCG